MRSFELGRILSTSSIPWLRYASPWAEVPSVSVQPVFSAVLVGRRKFEIRVFVLAACFGAAVSDGALTSACEVRCLLVLALLCQGCGYGTSRCRVICLEGETLNAWPNRACRLLNIVA